MIFNGVSRHGDPMYRAEQWDGSPLIIIGLREILQVPALQGRPVGAGVFDQQWGLGSLRAVLGMLTEQAACLLPFRCIPPVQSLH